MNMWEKFALLIALLVVLSFWLFGCADYNMIHRSQLRDTYENTRTFRAHVVPKPGSDKEKVNALGQLIEDTLKEWKGAYGE